MTTIAIDLTFRPATYWPRSPNREQLLSRIKGKARRDLARMTLETSGLAHMNAFIGRETLPEEDLRAWGMIHPALMGGEYLPMQPEGSAEIVRISLASVTSDQIVLYARQTHEGIRYAFVDEYDSRIAQPFEVREGTLSLGESIELIDSSHYENGIGAGGMVFGHLDANYHEDDDGLEEFVTVESAFYPDLNRYYESAIDRWIEARRRREANDRRRHYFSS